MILGDRVIIVGGLMREGPVSKKQICGCGGSRLASVPKLAVGNSIKSSSQSKD